MISKALVHSQQHNPYYIIFHIERVRDALRLHKFLYLVNGWVVVPACKIPRIINQDDVLFDGAAENGPQFVPNRTFEFSFGGTHRVMAIEPENGWFGQLPRQRWQHYAAIALQHMDVGVLPEFFYGTRPEIRTQLDGVQGRKVLTLRVNHMPQIRTRFNERIVTILLAVAVNYLLFDDVRGRNGFTLRFPLPANGFFKKLLFSEQQFIPKRSRKAVKKSVDDAFEHRVIVG